MGTWGVNIFSDDTACDVRDDYKKALLNGLSSKEATEYVLKQFSEELKDQDEGPVIYLALAATQWQFGYLDHDIVNKTIQIIDREEGLDRYKEEGLSILEKRKIALSKLKKQLLSPTPPPKKPKAYPRNPFKVGNFIQIKLPSGDYGVVRVIKEEGIERKSDVPRLLVVVCDYFSRVKPDPTFRNYRFLKGYDEIGSPITYWCSGGRLPKDTYTILFNENKPIVYLERYKPYESWGGWKLLPKYLEEELSLLSKLSKK